MQQDLPNMRTPENAEEIEQQNASHAQDHDKILHKTDYVHEEPQRPPLETSEFEHDQTKPKTNKTAETNQSHDAEAAPPQGSSPTSLHGYGSEKSEASLEDNGRERLKRHRVEMAGRVWIPDIWGQEELLKDWIDCTSFDASLINNNIVSARKALVEEARRANSSRLRIENSC